MKYQALFYQKNNEKFSRLSSAAVVIHALRVKEHCALYTVNTVVVDGGG